MKALIIAVCSILLMTLGTAAFYWPPAALGFVVVGPIVALILHGRFFGGVSARGVFVATAVAMVGGLTLASLVVPVAAWGFVVVGPVVALGVADMLQRRRAVLRNFPVIGHARYFFEDIRPEIQQYFIESNTDGRPFNREERSLVYQRAKGENDTVPFGTQCDVYAVGYEWINHSMAPEPVPHVPPRVTFGADTCERPYDAALLNISAMSFGSLSARAITALNRGAREGGFAHNTGEGSISPYHLQGGDLVWQVGTGYFGCRTRDGRFDPEQFEQRASLDAVKMIELKLSQGAKPGHGGILPASKITAEISKIRGVPMGADVISPPAHTAFQTPVELLGFLTELRRLSGGKPVGFKLCLGKRREFLAICKAMIETSQHPDFIAIDGGEGGTGAAPLEFSNSLGCPLTEALVFVHNALTGVGLRTRVRVVASGKVVGGFGLARLLALGADTCNAARSMMMALGCIQARRCNTNECPVGVATQRHSLVAGLDIDDKTERVARYQRETVEAALELVGAAGLEHPAQLQPWHIQRRTSPTEIHHYGELYEFVEPGCLLGSRPPSSFARAWKAAEARSFEAAVADRAA